MNNVFITGMLRSGTTLLDKMLCNHPQLSILSQPSIELFIEAKKTFYNSIGYRDMYHVLHHYFAEDQYQVNDLTEFLTSFFINKPLINGLSKTVFERSDFYVKDEEVERTQLTPGFFLEVFRQLLFKYSYRDDASLFGSKEVLCEEFLPFLTSQGIKCILIVRDPRDIITSLNFGKGKDFGGKLRPTLFNLRNWRKSIAFMIFLQGHKNFMSLKYEDLSSRPLEILDSIVRFLGVLNLSKDFYNKGIFDQSGNLWRGNSSHHVKPVVSNDSVGIFRKYLPEETLKYVESTCYPEMKFLNYKFEIQDTPNYDHIKRYREPFDFNRDDLPSDYSIDPEHVKQEMYRLELLLGGGLKVSDMRYFIFREVYAKLKKAMVI